MLGTTSVSLLGADDRCSLFERVREHLADDGRFFVSTLEIGAAEQERPVESVEVFMSSRAAGGVPDALCTFFEYVDWQRGRRFVSVLRQGAAGEALLATTSTNLIETGQLEAELQCCGLTIVERHQVAERWAIGPVAHGTVLLEARRSDVGRAGGGQ